MDSAKVFWSGRSLAVRLPRAFRVDAGEVRIRRRGRAIVLKPVPESIARRVRRYVPRDFGVSAVVIHELFYGAFKSQRVERNLAPVDALQFSVLAFTRRTPGRPGRSERTSHRRERRSGC